jgi:hypothetical protein
MSLAGPRFSSKSAAGPFHHGIRRRGGTAFWYALPTSGGRFKQTHELTSSIVPRGTWLAAIEADIGYATNNATGGMPGVSRAPGDNVSVKEDWDDSLRARRYAGAPRTILYGTTGLALQYSGYGLLHQRNAPIVEGNISIGIFFQCEVNFLDCLPMIAALIKNNTRKCRRSNGWAALQEFY